MFFNSRVKAIASFLKDKENFLIVLALITGFFVLLLCCFSDLQSQTLVNNDAELQEIRKRFNDLLHNQLMVQSELKDLRMQLSVALAKHRSTLNIIALLAAGSITILVLSYIFNKPVTHIPESVTAFIAENDQCVHNINVLILKIELLTRKEAANYDAIVLLQVKMSFLVDAANSVC